MTPSARRAPALAALLLAVLVSHPSAAAVRTPAASPRPAHWLHVRVWEAGAVAPNVSVRVPTALVSVTLGLLSWTGVFDHAVERARASHCDGPDGSRVILTGRDLVRLWSSTLRGGAAQLVAVHSGDGSAVEIGLE